MGEWKEYKLRDLFQGTKSGDWGKDSPEGNYVEEVTCLRGADIPATNLQEINKAPTRYISRKNFSERRLSAGDLMVEMSGGSPTQSTGRIAYISQNVLDLYNSRLICSNFCKVLQVNSYLIDSSFTYYLWSYLYNKRLFFSYENGTNGLKNLFLDAVLDYESVIIPKDIYEQNKIASQLSEIDNKIAINRKICRNLEAQAQALFKHWFVDFAPFKNGKFVESELGLIPVGWRVGTYDDIIQDTISGDWGKEKPEGNYTHKVACIRGCDFQDVKMGLRGKTPERYILEKNYNSKCFNDKDVLVEISGGTATVSTGRICPVSQLLINKYNGDIVCTNFCRLVRPRLGYSSYLYYSWKYKYDRKVMFGYENGTSGIKNFSIKDFTTREPLIIPKLSDLHIFEDMVEHIHTHIQNLGSESAKLAIIRDTLLPKLMSGQIKL